MAEIDTAKLRSDARIHTSLPSPCSAVAGSLAHACDEIDRLRDEMTVFEAACESANTDNVHLRALLKRAGEALRPFAGLAVEDQEMPVADDMLVSIPLMSKEPWREIFVGNLRAARAAAREIEETLGNE